LTDNNNHNVPGVSIDEALELYFSIALNGVKDEDAKAKLLAALREKVAKDRPEWAQSYANENNPAAESATRYSEIKAQIVEKANAEEIPQDPEEKYLYLRRKEARENALRKKELEEAQLKEEALREALIQQKQTQEDEVLQRAALIKKIILEKAKQKMSPQFGAAASLSNFSAQAETRQQNVIAFSETAKSPEQKTDEGVFNSNALTNEKRLNEGKPNATEWFKDFKSLSMDDRINSIREYNIKKRGMLQTRQELMWDRQSRGRKKNDEFLLEGSHPELGIILSLDPKEKNPRGLQIN
jgi:hypothetical protein